MDSIPRSEVAIMMDRMWKEMVANPFPHMCKHAAAGVVIQEMEHLGIAPPDAIIRAVVFADDHTALNWKRDDECGVASVAIEAVPCAMRFSTGNRA